MLTRSGWRYLSSRPLRRVVASSAFVMDMSSPLWTLSHRAPQQRVPALALFLGAPTNTPAWCVGFRRFDRHASSSSSPPPKGTRETSPLKDSSSLSPTESQSSRVTLPVDEEYDESADELLPAESVSWKERAKTFAVEYGRVGIATHLVLSVMSISVIYIVISSGVDVSGLLKWLGLSTNDADKDSAATSAGSFIIAYAIYKIASPVRWPLTFAVTPIVLRALRRRGYMLPTTKSGAHRSPRPETDDPASGASNGNSSTRQ